MKSVKWLALAAIATLAVAGCGDPNAGEDPAKAPQVPYQTMEEAGVKTPEQELQQLKQNDQRPAEDKGEGGM